LANAVDLQVTGTLQESALISGKVTAVEDGTVQVQGPQNTSTAVDTTFQQGSFLVAFRLS
jgi:hypothetical protein